MQMILANSIKAVEHKKHLLSTSKKCSDVRVNDSLAGAYCTLSFSFLASFLTFMLLCSNFIAITFPNGELTTKYLYFFAKQLKNFFLLGMNCLLNQYGRWLCHYCFNTQKN